MRLTDRFRRMIDGMPEEGSIILPVAILQGWLDETPSGVEPDLTVGQVADHFGRAPGTVRTWIRAGELRAHWFNNREYRVPWSAVEEYQEKQSQTQSQRPQLVTGAHERKTG